MKWVLVTLVLVACNVTAAVPSLRDPDAQFHWLHADATRAHDDAVSKRTLAANAEIIVGRDPYYQREKRFWAVPLAPLLVHAFTGVDVATAQLVLRAKDGYAVPILGARLLDGTAYLAVCDADLADKNPQWEPVGPRRADPAPFYLVWKGPGRDDLERYPRPWALEQIEVVPSGTLYPHAEPKGAADDSAARRGHAIFSRECIHCHAINREGGRVGPELNVPQSIVEYRPREQVRAYIRDPLQFRYGAMPAHPHLTDRELDDLIAYFDTMKLLKHDPERAAKP